MHSDEPATERNEDSDETMQGVADRRQRYFPDGIFYAALDDVAGGEQLLVTMAQLLGCPFDPTSSQATPLKEQLFTFLQSKQLLLLLDNFEHLLAESLLLAECLRAAPHVTIVVTSRERLSLQAEWVTDLRGLTLPTEDYSDPPLSLLLETDSVRLFLQSARRTWSGFPSRDEEIATQELAAIATLCRLVNGLPLAIELAAGWVQTLTCREIAAEIVRGIDLLASELRDVPERHRSIRAVIDTSWHRLTPAEQRLLRRLSCFRGSFDRAAAEAVAGATLPVLSSLVRKSLLRREMTDRYTLHSLIHHYAAEQLAQATVEQSETLHAHSAFYRRLLADWQPLLAHEAWHELPEQWTDDIENIRAAYLWTVQQGDMVGLAQMVQGIYLIFEQRGRYREGVELMQQGAAALHTFSVAPPQAGAPSPTLAELSAKLGARQGLLTYALGHAPDAQRLVAEAVTVASDVGDAVERAFCLRGLSMVKLQLGDHAAAADAARTALTLDTAEGQLIGIARDHNQLGHIALLTGDYTGAGQELETALQMARHEQLLRLEADCLDTLGQVCWNQGDYRGAKRY
ncbi:MAG: hypothetical protein KDE31_21585, partial [Caldilineaceae bacterium]|nr:hypothetical protein [Caldilineaceae bacterium]